MNSERNQREGKPPVRIELSTDLSLEEVGRFDYAVYRSYWVGRQTVSKYYRERRAERGLPRNHFYGKFRRSVPASTED